MKEKFGSDTGDYPEEKGNFSVYLENYKKEQKEIARLGKCIAEQTELLEAEKAQDHGEMVEKIKKEIAKLEKEKQMAYYRKDVEWNKHERATWRLEDFEGRGSA